MNDHGVSPPPRRRVRFQPTASQLAWASKLANQWEEDFVLLLEEELRLMSTLRAPHPQSATMHHVLPGRVLVKFQGENQADDIVGLVDTHLWLPGHGFQGRLYAAPPEYMIRVESFSPAFAGVTDLPIRHSKRTIKVA